MSEGRRHARYPVNLRLRLKLPTGELETVTDEVSASGFSAPCPALPEVGTQFGFVVHLPDGALVTGQACAMRIGDGGLAGFSCEYAPEQLAVWEAFLAQEHASGGVWRMLGRWATQSGEEKEAARSVLEKSRLGVLFKRLGGKGEEPAAEAPHAVLRLHMVGENGEAYRVAFEKHPSDPPEASAWAAQDPQLAGFLGRAASRVLRDDVVLKRAPSAEPQAVRLVELKRGGFGSVALRAGAKPSLMGLQGSELIAIEADGRPLFPFFDAAELDRIAFDTFRREPDEPKKAEAPRPPVREERFAAEYAHKTVVTQSGASHTELLDAMERAQRVQTRVYGERTLRLFPDLWLEVTRAGQDALRGFAVEDGVSLCVFALTGPGAPRVMKLGPTDRLVILRGREG